jgi:hypothetical protein
VFERGRGEVVGERGWLGGVKRAWQTLEKAFFFHLHSRLWIDVDLMMLSSSRLITSQHQRDRSLASPSPPNQPTQCCTRSRSPHWSILGTMEWVVIPGVRLFDRSLVLAANYLCVMVHKVAV